MSIIKFLSQFDARFVRRLHGNGDQIEKNGITTCEAWGAVLATRFPTQSAADMPSPSRYGCILDRGDRASWYWAASETTTRKDNITYPFRPVVAIPLVIKR
jgi:hypothetical protein